MSQNDWQFNVNEGYGNATPPEGTSILHSSLADPIPVSGSPEDRCRRWQFWANGNGNTGCFIRTKKTEFVNVEDTKAISVRAWVRSQNDGNRNAYTGIVIKATSDSWSPGGYTYDLRPSNGTFNLEGAEYSPPTGLSVQSNKWYHLRLDVVPIKHRGAVIMDHLKAFVEINGEWVFVAEKYTEATDGDFISWTGTKYNGVRHYYNSYYTTSYFYVDKIKMYLQDVDDRLEKLSLSLTNNVSTGSNVTADGLISVSGVETGADVYYSLDSYNWQEQLPAFETGLDTVYAIQIADSGKTSNPSKLDFLYVPEGPEFSSAATSSVYQGAGSDFLIYRAEASSVTEFSYDLKQVDDYADFSISSSSGLVYANNNLDYATKNSYNFTVTATDLAGNTTEKPVLLNVIEEDEHYYGTSLILKMDSDFGDSSVHQHTVTLIGNSTTSSTESKYGGTSGYFDGSDTLLIPADSNFQFGTQDFTFECWIYGGQQADVVSILDMRPQGQSGAYPTLYFTPTDDVLHFLAGSGGVIEATVSIFDSAWHHIAVSRNENSTKLFVDGSQVGSTIVDNNVYSSGANIAIMGTSYHNPPIGNSFEGYIDDVRITKGVARYTEDFAPPGPVPTIGPSEIVTEDLQLHLDASDTNSYSGTGTTWYDLSGNGNDGQISGSTYVSSSGGVFEFDGVNDGIIVSSNHLYQTGDEISVEAWINADDINDEEFQAFFTIGGVPSILRDRMFQMRVARYGGTPGHIDVLYRNSDNTTWQILKTTNTPIANNTWYHVVSTYTYGNGSSWKIYLNGVAQSTTFHSGNGNADPIQPADQSIYIGLGEDGGGSGEGWLGKIGKVSLYHKTLTAAEVLQNFEVTKSRFGLT